MAEWGGHFIVISIVLAEFNHFNHQPHKTDKNAQTIHKRIIHKKKKKLMFKNKMTFLKVRLNKHVKHNFQKLH